MDATAWIAIGSLALAGITVVLSYLNVRYQTNAAFRLEHTEWLRERQDEVDSRIIEMLLEVGEFETPEPENVQAALGGPMRYASDAVLAEVEQLQKLPKSALVEQLTAKSNLVRHVRDELVVPGRGSEDLAATLGSPTRGDRKALPNGLG
jgi:hypothetical protein